MTSSTERPVANAPSWIIEAARRPQSAAIGRANNPTRIITTPITANLDGPPIPEGTRDDTLTRIAGRLHDGRRSLEELTGELLEVNARRCQPPLSDAQVQKVATSIHRRTPCKRSSSTRATPEVLEALDNLEAEELLRRDQAGDWSGMGGKSERDAFVSLIVNAREHGELIPGGVRVSLSLRAWAISSAVSRRAMLDYYRGGERKPGIITRLKKRGLIRSDSAGRRDGESGAFVLVLPRAGFHHSSTGREVRGGGETLRAPRLRWSAPTFDRVGNEVIRSTIRRLGKGCGAVIDTLEIAGGRLTIRELAAALGTRRTRDIRRRLIARLETAGVVECFGSTVALTPDYRAALNRERLLTGELAAEERDRARYALEREAYSEARRCGELVSDREFARLRRDRDRIRPDERHPSGIIDDLEPAPAPDTELVETLRQYLDRYPRRREEKPNWLSVALWAEGYLETKPPPADVELALYELLKVAA